MTFLYYTEKKLDMNILITGATGFIAMCYASPDKANSVLGWSAKYSLEDMCRDSWNYQQQN